MNFLFALVIGVACWALGGTSLLAALAIVFAGWFLLEMTESGCFSSNPQQDIDLIRDAYRENRADARYFERNSDRYSDNDP